VERKDGEIDTAAVRRIPGVHAVITGAGVHGGLWGRAVKDVLVLAYDRVRFFGERVAAVAADDEDTAQRALDLIARTGELVTGRAHIEERGRAHITSFAAQVAEVAVDAETG
jgi:CO/xanthine dehydrogenase Mo-binding subunit